MTIKGLYENTDEVTDIHGFSAMNTETGISLADSHGAGIWIDVNPGDTIEWVRQKIADYIVRQAEWMAESLVEELGLEESEDERAKAVTDTEILNELTEWLKDRRAAHMHEVEMARKCIPDAEEYFIAKVTEDEDILNFISEKRGGGEQS